MLILLGFFFGFWRYSFSIPQNTPDKIWYYNENQVNLQGVVCNEPDQRQKNQKLEICVNKVEKKENNSFGKILVTTNLYPSYKYGDNLQINCLLKKPDKFSGFSYDRYLARYHIYSVCYYPKITLLKNKKINNNKLLIWQKYIFKIKDKISSIIYHGLGEPDASLAQAIILGNKKNIPKDLKEKFSQTGISHIIAISGMHISIISVLIMGFLLQIGLMRRQAFYLASIFLLTYIVLIGLPASAMRAGLMGFLVLLAMNLGRLNKLCNSLFLVAVILLVINPKLLLDDIGFQLSFLAVLGITWIYPILEKINIKKFQINSKNKFFSKIIKAIFSILNITMAVQVFTLPILVFNFSQVSIIAPVSNLLILWILPFLMISVLVGIILSAILPGLAIVFFLPTSLFLKLIIFLIDLLVKVPYAYLDVGYLWWGWGVIYYIIVLYIIKSLRTKLLL